MSAIYQCCYTHTAHSWEPVAVSSEIPKGAYDLCVRYQDINSNIRGAMHDERGGVLNLLQVIGGDGFVAMMRTQYGLLEHGDSGRSSMFSHAYVQPWTQDLLSDPSGFLSISDSSFAADLESAELKDGKPEQGPSLSLATTLSSLRLDVEKYTVLVKCAYLALKPPSGVEATLYVQHDGTGEQLRALMYCIYQGLPLFLRRNIKMASCESINTAGMNIIFTENASSKSQYVNPFTGDNNVLDERLELYLGRLGYIDYFTKHCLDAAGQSFFTRLKEAAKKLGNEDGADELTLKIAFQGLPNANISGYDDAALSELLSDALRARSKDSGQMEHVIACAIEEYCKRNLVLTNNVEELLAAKLAAPHGEELSAAAEHYQIARMLSLPIEEAVERLKLFDPATLNRYAHVMSKSSEGQAVLDAFYAAEPLPIDPENGNPWQALADLLDKSADVACRPQTIARVEEEAYNLYLERVTGPSPADALAGYRSVMSRVLPSDEMEGCIATAKEAYWDDFDFAGIDAEEAQTYKAMKVDHPRCWSCLEALGLILDAQAHTADAYIEDVARSILVHRNTLTREDKDALAKAFGKAALQCYDGRDAQDIDVWVALASEVQDSDARRMLLDVRTTVVDRDFSSFRERFGSFANERNEGWIDARTLVDVSKYLLDRLKKEESEACQVPLDAWILVARYSEAYANPFSVLDDAQPSLLVRDPAAVFDGSICLKRDYYVQFAERYVKDHGPEAKVVGRWLSEARKFEKRERKLQQQRNKRPSVSAESVAGEAGQQAGQTGKDSILSFLPFGKRESDSKSNKHGGEHRKRGGR